MSLVPCACGCGELIAPISPYGRATRFRVGHQSPATVARVRLNATSKSTGYARSKRLVPSVDQCELAHIGGCSGPLQRAHLDGNPLHNVRTNIKVFCNAHHMLYDRGRIDLANPVMPDFFVSGDGKRRYRPRLKVRTCKHSACGKVFDPKANGQRYCSGDCKRAAIKATAAFKTSNPVYRCDWCGRFYSSALPDGSACQTHIPEHNARLAVSIARSNERLGKSFVQRER